VKKVDDVSERRSDVAIYPNSAKESDKIAHRLWILCVQRHLEGSNEYRLEKVQETMVLKRRTIPE
jgi:hypothetical protein